MYRCLVKAYQTHKRLLSYHTAFERNNLQTLENMSQERNVDESPISPIERRDSLEKHLQTRPDPKDLKDRHILLDTNAAP